MEQIKAEPEIIALWQHGIISSTNSQGDQIVAKCIFCNKEDHLYITTRELTKDDGKVYSPGTFDCKSCGKRGNLFTVLNYIYQQSAKTTTVDDVRALAEERGIPPQSFRFSKPVKSYYNQRWLFPHYTLKKEGREAKIILNNLYIYSPDDKVKMRSTASCKQTLFNLQSMVRTVTQKDSPNGDEVWVTEGHWDCCILENELFNTPNPDNKFRYVLGVPGASIFNTKWSIYFEEKDVKLVFDNDAAGLNGMKRICGILSGSKVKPKSVKVIAWPEEYNTKHDVRDEYKTLMS